MDIGEKIKALRIQRGMTLEDVGIIVGVGKSTVRKWETGDIKNMRRDKIQLVAQALNVSPQYLMGWVDSQESHTENAPSDVSSSSVSPDIELAAAKAMEILIKYKVSRAPILPMSILQSMSNVLVVTFTEMAGRNGLDQSNMAALFGAENQDIFTYYNDGKYCVAYNQRLPYYMLQRAMARELGHILLGHNTKPIPEDVKISEALFFSRHLLCPRPLLKYLFDEGITLTVETLGNITGLYGRSLAGIREMPGVHIPAKQNRKVKEQFADYLQMLVKFKKYTETSCQAMAEFGTYMDNYEE